MKFRVNDTIKVTAGKDRGKTGVIEKVFPDQLKVLVKGVNLYKRHLKKREGFEGGVISKERPLPVASVAIICPVCGKLTRAGFRLPTQGKKERICKKCQGSLEQLSKPEAKSKKK